MPGLLGKLSELLNLRGSTLFFGVGYSNSRSTNSGTQMLKTFGASYKAFLSFKVTK
jgi:hypothetical protein